MTQFRIFQNLLEKHRKRSPEVRDVRASCPTLFGFVCSFGRIGFSIDRRIERILDMEPSLIAHGVTCMTAYGPLHTPHACDGDGRSEYRSNFCPFGVQKRPFLFLCSEDEESP